MLPDLAQHGTINHPKKVNMHLLCCQCSCSKHDAICLRSGPSDAQLRRPARCRRHLSRLLMW